MESILDQPTNYFASSLSDLYGTSPAPNPTSSPSPATTGTSWTDWLKGLTGLTTAAAPIVGSVLGTTPKAAKPNTVAAAVQGNPTLWIGIGVAIIALLVGALFFFRR